MVKVPCYVELHHMLEELIVLTARMNFRYFFCWGFSLIVQVGFFETGVGAAKIISDLPHGLFVEDMFGPSEGLTRPSVVVLPLTPDAIRFQLFLDDVAFGGIVVVLAAL